MARPIKMHEDALLKVMQKSLKPLTMITAGISKAIIGNKESQLEGARRAEQIKKNAIDQTNVLNTIAGLLKDGNLGSSKSTGNEDTSEGFGWKMKLLGTAIVVAVAASPLGSAIAGMQSMYGFFTSGQGPAMFAKKWKEITTNWTTKWNNMLKIISENKLVTTISEKWTAMKTKISGWWKKFDIFGTVAVTKEGGATGGRFTKVVKWLGKVMLLKPIQFLMKWVRPIYALFGIFDIFSQVKEGDEKNKAEGKTVAERVASGANTARTTFLKWFFDEMVVGTIGSIVSVFTSWGQGKKWGEGTGHDWGTRFTKFREDIEKIIWGKIKGLFNFLKLAATDPKAAFSKMKNKIFGSGSDDKTNTPTGTEAEDNINRTTKQNSMGTTGDKPGFFGNVWEGFKSDLSQSFSSSSGPHRPIGDDGGTTNMSGVNWNKLHGNGRKGVESAIWSVYDKYGKTPTFTSGLREKGHAQHNPKSQHAYGLALDLRSKDLGSDLPAIRDELSAGFKNAGWFFQHEVKGQMNSTGTAASADHFHMHKAAKGFHGYVDKMTGFIAGEAGRERVDITPMNSPDKNMNNLNTLHRERAMSGMGSPPVSITNVTNQSSNVSSNSVLLPGIIRSKELYV